MSSHAGEWIEHTTKLHGAPPRKILIPREKILYTIIDEDAYGDTIITYRLVDGTKIVVTRSWIDITRPCNSP